MFTMIIPAEEWHAAVIGANARQADIDELAVTSGNTPEEAMLRGMRGSVRAYTGLVDNVPVCMFGAAPFSIMGGIGTAWMIGSTGLQPLRVQKALLRESREMLDVLQAMFPTLLYNFVDARNDCAIRWLKWLGFTFDDPIPMGRGKHPFFPFYRQGRC